MKGSNYLFYDGDRMGEQFEACYLSENLVRLKVLSSVISDLHAAIKDLCEPLQAAVVESGGDEGLVRCDGHVEPVRALITNLWAEYGLGVSVGIGMSARDAFLACGKAKREKVAKHEAS